MKEKILFIAALVGSFSATIILLITQGLTMIGVDTSGYIDIINIVGTGLAIIILVFSAFFLNKYSAIQKKLGLEQNALVTNALDTNANLMQTILPKLASEILSTAEARGSQLLQSTEVKINQMMNEMLPNLAEQTMRLVTQQSQDIVDQTTAKATDTMKMMSELIPTYSKQISDSVAQTVRENNAHYHKMLTDIKALYLSMTSVPIAASAESSSPDLSIFTMQTTQIEAKLTALETSLTEQLNAALAKLLEASITTIPVTNVPSKEAPLDETQNVPSEEESGESSTA